MNLRYLLATATLAIPVAGLPTTSSNHSPQIYYAPHGTRGIVVPSFSAVVPISDTVINLVQENTRSVSHESWELGVMSEAYLEIEWPQMSVYGYEGVPPPRSVTNNNNTDNITSILEIANYVIAIRPEGIDTLIDDSSVGDPASVGVALLMANWTKASRPDEALNDYNTPLIDELNYLLYDAPRTDDGAISHRSEQVQLWSDFVYMVPPFLAYYGALNQPYVSDGLLYDAYLQISLYRNYLYDATPGLWRHVALGQWQDIGYWSTGNGWAAAGMLRVLMTMNQTSLGTLGQFAAAQIDLQNWATDIVNNVWTYQQPSGCLLNYATDTTTFEDSSSTALLASVTYRLAALPVFLRGASVNATINPTVQSTYSGPLNPLTSLSATALNSAHKARDCVKANLNDSGWLNNVVNPYDFSTEGDQSAEGQSFVLLMEAAWRAWFDYAQEQG
ncbi:hypothetical protein FRB94_001350 [Tulasnella sp. JGI-2019a]|nr:hypothetical protein FRB93_000624 [Tulasnella sp. JGI-2019a]KAG9005707.1 hypothetical protein FRB94_001350 [Tulasnella sp. JGI-2019a]KAG9034975.1 hypothetical protein FRB95_012265 [Tulasnella sp. JGI-2019a]